jgi:hypothetical protein
MRPILLCGFLAALWAAAAVAAPPVHGALTIVLDFQGAHSDKSVAEMKREFESIMRDSGVRFAWRLRTDASGETHDNLVVVRFKGKCVLEPVGYLYDERGPLAFTYSSDGAMQPFSEVECDKVTASVRSAMWGGEYAKADELLGRALGRVMAHEVVHMFSDSGHGKEGVTAPALSGRQLISPELKLTPADWRRVHLPR